VCYNVYAIIYSVSKKYKGEMAMTEELLKELQRRFRWLVNQVQSETNKYHQDCLIGRIEEVESIIALIEKLEEKQNEKIRRNSKKCSKAQKPYTIVRGFFS